MSEESSGGGCGCGGILALIAFIFFVYACIWGLPIGGKVWNIDLFPPAIRDVSKQPVLVVEPDKIKLIEEDQIISE